MSDESVLRTRPYWKRWLAAAFTHTNWVFDLIGGIPGIVALFAFALGKRQVITDQTLNDVAGYVALAGFSVVALARLLMASHWVAVADTLMERQARVQAEQERDIILDELKKVKKSQPAVILGFVKDGPRQKLVVKNIGAPALFHAQSLILWVNTGPRSELFRSRALRWEMANDTQARLVTGGEDYLFVADVDTQIRPIAAVRLTVLADAGVGASWAHKGLWESTWFPEATGIQPAEPMALVQVSITAEPELEDGPVKTRFQLGPGALHPEDSGGFRFDKDNNLLPPDQSNN